MRAYDGVENDGSEWIKDGMVMTGNEECIEIGNRNEECIVVFMTSS